MSTFQSSKNYMMIGLLWLIIIFLLAIPLFSKSIEDADKMPIIGIVLIYFIAAMLIWILIDTKYKIEKEQLFYCSGPIRGRIKIKYIHKAERWNKWYTTSLLKPALGNDGLIIYYNKFDDIYISPKNKDGFIAALREINPDIEVV